MNEWMNGEKGSNKKFIIDKWIWQLVTLYFI